ncbi:hypothetical protein ACFL59_01605 [Planctomycetota bacterium]
MTQLHRLALGVTMTLALAFGFLHLLMPACTYPFERLHVFLFNLVSGGSVILAYSSRPKAVTGKVYAYFVVALGYAVSAFLGAYALTLLLTLPLVVIVESVRVARFSFLPLQFFRRNVSLPDKFNLASLLCLSTGLTVASFVIVNEEYLHLLTADKLTLDVFFLGYSFPVSLITMSAMFTFFSHQEGERTGLVEELCFWAVNLGVIVFFAFILLELLLAEVAIAVLLFLTVCVIFLLFVRSVPNVQQKNILMSGMAFLVCTGLTGIAYLLLYFAPTCAPFGPYALTLHAFVSLYGWNLCGIFVIVRESDFPLRMSSRYTILLHWVTVFLLAPLGKTSLPIAMASVSAYVVLLAIVFLSRGEPR